jgi:hypothetical protein
LRSLTTWFQSSIIADIWDGPVLCPYWLISLRLRVANFSALVFGNKARQCRIGTCTEGSCSETWPAAHNVQALVRLIWEHELISPLDASLEIYRPHPSNTQQIEFRFVELFLLRASAMAVLCFLAIAVEESWE